MLHILLQSNNTSYNLANPIMWGGSSIYGKSGLGADIMQFDVSNVNTGVMPADAYSIDSKMDDGILYSGVVYTAKGNSASGQANKYTTNDTNYQSSLATISSDSYYLPDTTYSFA